MSKHTPGPWQVGERRTSRKGVGSGLPIIDTDEGEVALVNLLYAQAHANARRIVECVNALQGFADPNAAGELLEAAKVMLREAERQSGSNAIQKHVPRLRAAIAKAEGTDDASRRGAVT